MFRKPRLRLTLCRHTLENSVEIWTSTGWCCSLRMSSQQILTLTSVQEELLIISFWVWTSGLSHGTLYAPSQRHWKVFESNTKTNLQYLKVGFNPSEGRYAAELLWHDCPIPQEKKASYLSILIEIVPKWFVVHCPLQKYCLWRRNKGLMWHLWSSQDLCKRLMDNYELLLRGGFVLRHEKENTQLIFNLMKAFCENVLQGTVCHGATMLSFIFNFTLHM